MLIAEYKNLNQSFPLLRLEVHINEEISIDKLENVADGIEFIYADGDELDAIKANFQNIPMAKNRGVIWRGETAKFIAANFPTNYDKEV